MGCTPEQGNCYEGERPTHKVTLPDFYIGELQVTQKLWRAIMGLNIQQQWMMNAKKGMLLKGGRTASIDINEAAQSEGEFSHPSNPHTIYEVVSRRGRKLFDVKDFSKVSPFLNSVGDDYPMYFINYRDCELFCFTLTQLLADQLPEGYKFRIPTEAQWEYAARGGIMNKGYTFAAYRAATKVRRMKGRVIVD